jgi:hypothetical protein
MWKNTYKDYKPDEKFTHKSVEPGKGIIGCEMNETFGWGAQPPPPSQEKIGLLRILLRLLFKWSF